MDLHHLVVDNGHVTYIQAIGVQKLVEGLGVIKFLDLGLVESLSKFTPHGIEHHFSQGTQSRVVFDVGILQLDALLLVVLSDVGLFFFFGVVSFGPPTGFLLDFQPSVDVVSEQPLTGFFKMPDFIDVQDVVPELDGFLLFGAAPGTCQGAFLVGVRAMIGSV